MKSLFPAAISLALVSSAAAAQVVEFRGAMCLTSVSAACATDGWAIGDCLLLRYSPPNLGSNGTATEFSVMGQSFGANYATTTGTLVGTALLPVHGVHVGRTGYTFNASMRISSQSPPPVLTTTAINLAGNINNFDATAGCNVGFRGSVTKRP